MSGLDLALQFINDHTALGVTPFARKKTTTFYELARLAPAGGVIVELGAYHGEGTVPLWHGAQDGNRNKVIAVDAYKEMHGWIGEPYGPQDQMVWFTNMVKAGVRPYLYQGDSQQKASFWQEPIALLIHDLGSKNRMPQDVMDWERHIIVGGLLAMRDIDDYSMGTEQAVANLLATGRWGKRRDWDAFITSLERIA